MEKVYGRKENKKESNSRTHQELKKPMPSSPKCQSNYLLPFEVKLILALSTVQKKLNNKIAHESPNWDCVKDNKKLTILRDSSLSKMGSTASDLSVTVVISSVSFFTPKTSKLFNSDKFIVND
jgi:hypothetical protein